MAYHNGCIAMAYPQCASIDALLDYFSLKNIGHTACIDIVSSPVCVLMCFKKLLY